MPIIKTVNHDFFKKWSSDMAYVLGFFAADGSMIKTKRNGHYLEFHITDKSILLKIKLALGSNHKISKRCSCVITHKTMYRLQIGSKKIFNDLKKLGFSPAKTKTLKFPKIEHRYLKDFIRGYFDGDGCVYLKKLYRRDRNKYYLYFMTSFTCGNGKFLIELLSKLKRNNILGGSIVKKERGWELKFSKRDSLALYDFMYNNSVCSLFLQRKKSIFDKAIKKFKNNAVVV